MNVISERTLRQYYNKHPQCSKQLNLIVKELKKGFFENVNQLKDVFPYISVLNDNRVVFNIHGNDYRLILKINYAAKTAYVRFVGTHAEYDKIDAKTI